MSDSDSSKADKQTVGQPPVLTVKTLSDRKIQVELTEQIATVGQVMAVLRAKEGEAAITDHHIICKGSVLKESQLLSDLFPGENEEKIVHLFYFEPVALLVDPLELSPDWDAKNRLKVFKGTFCLSRRQFAEGADLLCSSLPTFAETSFISFKECVRYAVISGALVFDRPQLHKRIIRSPEVLEVISDIPECDRLVSSLYSCRYAEFFRTLAELEQWLHRDWLLGPHTAYLVKELRVKAYKQILTAYRSLQLSTMAQVFGVSEEFIDEELSRFIAGGRLNATINRVAGLVETIPLDLKHAQYIQLLKEGDALLNKVQRLSRMVSY